MWFLNTFLKGQSNQILNTFLKGQSNYIFNLQFFSSFKPARALPNVLKYLIKIFVQISLSYSNFSVGKTEKFYTLWHSWTMV